MKIKLNEMTIREVFNGYVNNDEEGGVRAYDGKLNIRPPYQREFCIQAGAEKQSN